METENDAENNGRLQTADGDRLRTGNSLQSNEQLPVANDEKHRDPRDGTSTPPDDVDHATPRSALLVASAADPTPTDVDGLPDHRRRRCSMPLFVANVSCLLLFWMTSVVYTSCVLRTLERKFGLRSVQTGLIISCNDATIASMVVFVGYFGRRANKPRILGVTALFSVAAGLLMASPHWLVEPATSLTSADVRYNLTRRATEFCSSLSNLNSTGESHSPDCPTTSHQPSASSVHPALLIFIIAQILNGIGGSGLFTLSLAYIDENASKSRSPIYVGVAVSMNSLGPVAGFMLAAVTLRFPEDLITGTSEERDEASFIGCWWLGYLLCAVGILLSAIPLFLFPISMKEEDDDQQANDKMLLDSTKQTPDSTLADVSSKVSSLTKVWKMITEFPRGLLHLFCNKPYVVNLGCSISVVYVIMGVLVNMVRYIEIHFHQPPFVASLISALVSALAAAVGGLIGGLLVSKLELKVSGAVKLMIFATASFTIGIGFAAFIVCPQIQIAGQLDSSTNRFSVDIDCNRQCACRAADRKSFSPVCGDDNMTYFSACFAGCSDVINETFVGCSCITRSNVSMSTTGQLPGTAAGSARSGECLAQCILIIPYAVTMFFASLIMSFGTVPAIMVNFRVVDDDERSFALALNSFLSSLFGFMPSPLLFGSLIDSTCRLWEQTTTATTGCPPSAGERQTGSCLLFDTAKFRHRTYGVAFCFELVNLTLVVILFRLVRNRTDLDEQNGKNGDNRKRKNSTAEIEETTNL